MSCLTGLAISVNINLESFFLTMLILFTSMLVHRPERSCFDRSAVTWWMKQRLKKVKLLVIVCN